MERYERQPLTNSQIGLILFPKPPEIKVKPVERNKRYNPKHYYVIPTFVKEEAPVYYRRYTPAQYLEIERRAATRHEYFDGHIYPMAEETAAHQLVLSNLVTLLRAARKTMPFTLSSTDKRLHVPENDLFTYPDIALYPGKAERSPLDKNTAIQPVMLIEILSKTTQSYDRGNKFKYYRDIPSLQEYILIDPEAACIEHFFRNTQNHWELEELNSLTQPLQLRSVPVCLQLSKRDNR